MRVKTFITALLLAPSLYCYAEDAQPDGDLLEFLAGLEVVDGELLDPIEINDMLETNTTRDITTRGSDNE